MAAAAIAAAAISAAGAVAGGVVSAQGAQAAAKAGRPRSKQFPVPKSIAGLRDYYNRLLAVNLKNEPPSFSQYVGGGGPTGAYGQFPLQDPGMTPKEAEQLGLVGPRGQPIPYADPAHTKDLTTEQKLYLGYMDAIRGHKSALERAYLMNRRIGRLERQGYPTDAPRIERLRRRRDIRLGAPVGTGGLK